jgi:hypothetical protein
MYWYITPPLEFLQLRFELGPGSHRRVKVGFSYEAFAASQIAQRSESL